VRAVRHGAQRGVDASPAAGIGLARGVTGQRLRRAGAAVDLSPGLEVCRSTGEGNGRVDPAHAAGIRDHLIVRAAELRLRDGARGRAVATGGIVGRTRGAVEVHRCHGGDQLGGAAREVVGHPPTIGATRGVDALAVDASLFFERREQGPCEADIIDVLLMCGPAATLPHIPGALDAIGPDHDEPSTVRDAGPAGRALPRRGRATPRVEVDDHRYGYRSRISGGHVTNERPRQPGERERLADLAGGGGCRCWARSGIVAASAARAGALLGVARTCGATGRPAACDETDIGARRPFGVVSGADANAGVGPSGRDGRLRRRAGLRFRRVVRRDRRATARARRTARAGRGRRPASHQPERKKR